MLAIYYYIILIVAHFFAYIINVLEFTSGYHLQIYNIKSGLSSPRCFFYTSDFLPFRFISSL